MLLSRVAESVYWAGRYLERAEATARLVKVHSELHLDLPRSAGLGWAPLLAVTGAAVTGAGAAGATHPASEEQVIATMAVDPANAASILASVAQARSNLRAARALMPRAAWEVLNELHLWAADTAPQAVERRTRLVWLDTVERQCQLLCGLLAGTMSHDETYAFLEVGRFVERADMTTRVLDVQAGILLGETGHELEPYADVTWMGVLRCLSGHHAFRRATPGAPGPADAPGPEALRFLLRDPQFPRSVEHCLIEVSRALLELPRCEAAMARCADLQRRLEAADVARLADPPVLHAYLDALQAGLAELHDLLAATWFRAAAEDADAGALVVTG